MTPTEGRIDLLGKDVATFATQVHYNTGYMPQRFGLYEELSVLENLRLYARLRGLEPRHAATPRLGAVEFTRLERFMHRLARASCPAA